MTKQKESNYNFEGVDLNIYTARRAEDIEYYADKLEYLKEYYIDKYNMITEIIEMSAIITHDIRNVSDNIEKNILIREISSVKGQKNIKKIKAIVDAIINKMNEVDKRL